MKQFDHHEAALVAAESLTNLGHYSIYLELGTRTKQQRPLTFQRLRELLAEHIHLAPPLRRRVRRVPLAVDEPWWIEDPHFDLDYHVRHVAVPGADDPAALEGLLARLHERALDPTRPLWELYLIDIPDGRRGLFIKVHVVLTDALGPFGPLAPLVADRIGDAGAEPESWRPDMVPTDQELLIKAAWATLRSPARSMRRSLEIAQQLPLVGRFAFMVSNMTSAPRHPVEGARRDHAVPRASFNRPLGAHRRVARCVLPVGDVKRVRQHLGVTFHDVVLGVVSGALRHWLIVNDELPPESLVALTPLVLDVTTGRPGAALVPLATELHDPAERIGEIHTVLSEISEQMSPCPVDEIRHVDGIPIALAGAASQLLVTSSANIRFLPPFNVYVVNIPGGDVTEIDGYPILAKHALCPIIDGIGLSISAVSLGDELHLTLVSDRDLVPDLDVIAAQMSVELEVLVDAVPAPTEAAT